MMEREHMTINTLGYVKRLEAAGLSRAVAEAHATAMSDEVFPQLATTKDLERLGDRLAADMAKHAQAYETSLWKHSLAVVLGVLAAGGFLIRFMPH